MCVHLALLVNAGRATKPCGPVGLDGIITIKSNQLVLKPLFDAGHSPCSVPWP